MHRPNLSPGAFAAGAAAGVLGFGLAGCANHALTPTAVHTPPPCAFATCGTDRPSLAKATASAVGVELEKVAIIEAEPQFNGAVLVWRATVSGKTYACKQGRDPATGAVHYVTCLPSRDTGPLKAFP
ncbi:MAG: hypothetical protein ACYDD1_10520 [Caulobacteraceae bacterium]